MWCLHCLVFVGGGGYQEAEERPHWFFSWFLNPKSSQGWDHVEPWDRGQRNERTRCTSKVRTKFSNNQLFCTLVRFRFKVNWIGLGLGFLWILNRWQVLIGLDACFSLGMCHQVIELLNWHWKNGNSSPIIVFQQFLILCSWSLEEFLHTPSSWN